MDPSSFDVLWVVKGRKRPKPLSRSNPKDQAGQPTSKLPRIRPKAPPWRARGPGGAVCGSISDRSARSGRSAQTLHQLLTGWRVEPRRMVRVARITRVPEQLGVRGSWTAHELPIQEEMFPQTFRVKLRECCLGELHGSDASSSATFTPHCCNML